MEVEFTARQVSVPKALRTQAAEGLERIARILGRTARASVDHVPRATTSADCRVNHQSESADHRGSGQGRFVGVGASKIAIQHAENQALRYRDHGNLNAESALPKLEKELLAPPVAHPKRGSQPEISTENGRLTRAKVKTSIAVHSFPASNRPYVEPHIPVLIQRRSDCRETDDH